MRLKKSRSKPLGIPDIHRARRACAGGPFCIPAPCSVRLSLKSRKPAEARSSPAWPQPAAALHARRPGVPACGAGMIAGPSRSGADLASRTPAGAGPRARGQFSRSPPSGSLPAEPSLLMTASPPAASTRRARPWAWTSCGRLARHGCDGAQPCRGAAGKASPAMARGTLRPADAPAAGRPAGADRNQPNRRRRGRSWQPQRRARADRGAAGSPSAP